MRNMLGSIMVAGMLVQLSMTADYDHKLAARLVNYAGATYCCGTESVAKWSCSACQNVPGFTQISQVFGSKHHGRALVGFDNVLQARIVAFMGTNTEIETWIDDINLNPSPCYTDVCPGCTCHPGFKATYDEIKDDVFTHVSDLSPGKLIITGHSLGAAQATFCAYDLHVQGSKVDHVYTVGQPRVGNDAFSYHYASLNLDHWRVTHHQDPIPHLPWRGVGSYRHIVREAYYADATSGRATRVCSAVNSEDPLCADQFNDELTVLHIPDHWVYLGFHFAKNLMECTFVANSSMMVI